MWGYLFGNSKAQKDAPKKAIVEMREHINMLNKKQAHLTTQMAEQEAIARANITKNKTAAKNALKRKKVYEAQLEKIESQIDSLETQLMSIENANLNLETMKAMKSGASAMKQIHKGFNIDKVDETMDEIREQVELGDEISDAISRPLGTDYVDEDELEDELEALQQEELDSGLVREPAAKEPVRKVELPSAPSTQLEDEEDEDEKALKALQAEMGL